MINVEQLLHDVPGGIGRYTAALAALLPPLFPDDEYLFVTARHRLPAVENALRAVGADPAAAVVLPLPRPVLYDAWHKLGFPSLAATSRRLRGVDLVHAPSLAVPPSRGVPLVVTVHDVAAALYPTAFTRRGRWFHAAGLRAAIRRADIVIAPTAAAVNEIIEHTGFARERTRVIHHGVSRRATDDARLGQVLNDLGIGSRPYLLWVGTIEPRKDVPLLVRAFERLVRDHGVPHTLVLAGPIGWGGGAEVVRDARDSLGDRVVIPGAVPEDSIAELYAGADLFVLPSRHEGFGLTVIEAMAAGTAVVCSDIPVLREVTGGAAALVGSRAPEEWALVLASLLRDAPRRRELERRGAEHSATLTWERTIRQTRAVYDEAVELAARR